MIGDGACAKGNAPFKDTRVLLFDKKLVFRWDYHLINRAHIGLAAKGKIEAARKVTVNLPQGSMKALCQNLSNLYKVKQGALDMAYNFQNYRR